MPRPLIVIALAVALNGPIYAQTEREHGVHVHGRSQVNLAVDHERIELELTAPGMDIVGFEHEARDDAQRRAIDAALAVLNDPGAWLAFEPVGACTPGEVNAHTHGYAKAEHDQGHDHGDYHGHDKAHDDRAHGHDDHEHAHDHDHDHDEHAEFHLRLRADCTDQPRAIHLRLREHFPGIELLRVDLVTPDAQDRVELRHGQTRVRLQP